MTIVESCTRNLKQSNMTPRAQRIELYDLPLPLNGTIPVRVWSDPRVELSGHDARSSYVELFWLGILGPSATLLLRRLAIGLAHSPQGFHVPVGETALSLGLGRPTTMQSPFVRALHRLCIFKLIRFVDGHLEVRTKVPTLNHGQLARLPEALQVTHEIAESKRRHPSNARFA